MMAMTIDLSTGLVYMWGSTLQGIQTSGHFILYSPRRQHKTNIRAKTQTNTTMFLKKKKREKKKALKH